MQPDEEEPAPLTAGIPLPSGFMFENDIFEFAVLVIAAYPK
jgi:hypothetical protein